MWKLPPTSRRRIEIYRNALDAIRDTRGLAQLNLDRQRGRSARFALAAARGGTLTDARGHHAWRQPTRVE